MVDKYALAILAAFFVLNFFAFGMQRSTLLLAREANLSPLLTKQLLPAWFPLTWLVIAGKWATLIYIGYYWSLWFAIGLAVADIILSSILPIPYRVYLPFFRARIEQHQKNNPELAAALRLVIESSSLVRGAPLREAP